MIRLSLPTRTFSTLSIFPSSRLAEALRAPQGSPARHLCTTGHRVIAWIEEHCRYSSGDWVGQPFRLLPWQKQWLLELFEVVPTDDLRFPEDPATRCRWRRRYRWALLGVPKKNGKTELLAALSLYLLIADDEGAPYVAVAASADRQADVLFGAARSMCELSPTLSQVTDPQVRVIVVPGKTNAIVRRITAASGTNDGPNVHAAMIDELHEWRSPKHEGCFDVVTNGTGARKQPMIIMITTAGHDDESICGEWYEHGEKLLRGDIEDDTFYYAWWQPRSADGEPLGTDAKHDHVDIIRSANPSWGQILGEEFYLDQLRRKTESVFRRYFLNQWTEAEEVWEAAAHWSKLAGTPKLDEYLPLFVGIDVGRRHDSAAVAWSQWDHEAGKLMTAQRIWRNPHRRGTAAYEEWRFGIYLVEELLRELHAQFPIAAAQDEHDNLLPGPANYYDPHFFARSAELLTDDGLTMLEWPQTDARMIPASQRLYELVIAGEIVHDGDRQARSQVRNVVAREKERGWRISRPIGSGKCVDYPVALSMSALGATAWRERTQHKPQVR